MGRQSIAGPRPTSTIHRAYALSLTRARGTGNPESALLIGLRSVAHFTQGEFTTADVAREIDWRATDRPTRGRIRSAAG